MVVIPNLLVRDPRGGQSAQLSPAGIDLQAHDRLKQVTADPTSGKEDSRAGCMKSKRRASKIQARHGGRREDPKVVGVSP
jgi:hypothetical protein